MGRSGPGGGVAWGRYRKQAEARRIVRLSHEFMADVGWWRWVLGSGGGYGGERIIAPSFSFVKQLSSRTWLSDASLTAIYGLCMETGVYWKLDLPEEVQKRTIRGEQAVGDLISIKLLEVMAIVMTSYVMVDMRGERPVRRGEAFLMRGDNEAAVAWAKRFQGGCLP